MNRTLQDRARSVLVGAGLGGGFWVEAISAASYIRNWGHVAGLNKTPDGLWSSRLPSVKRVHRCISRNMAKGTRNQSSDYPCKVSSKQWGGGEDE